MVGGRCVRVALVALVAAACSVDSGSRPDAGDDPGEDGGGSDIDASPGAAGLVLEFRGVPALTASFGGDFPTELEEVRIDLEDVRAVGDAAPGDERTSEDEVRLEWRGADDDGEEEAENDPVVVTFDQAPPGLYSSVFAELKHYRLRGKVELAEDNEPDFDIDDMLSSALAISIPLGGVTLEAGETRRVTIDVSVADVVIETRWDEVTPDGEGNLRVTSSSPQIAGIREGMQDAFGYQSDDDVSSSP